MTSVIDSERTQKGKGRGNGQGSTYRSGDDWVAALSWYENGKRKVRKRMAATSEEADRKLTALKNERDAGVTGAGRSTVEGCLNEWLTVAAPKRRTKRGPISAKTLADHKSLIDVHRGCPAERGSLRWRSPA
jgi:hypothetical protein